MFEVKIQLAKLNNISNIPLPQQNKASEKVFAALGNYWKNLIFHKMISKKILLFVWKTFK